MENENDVKRRKIAIAIIILFCIIVLLIPLIQSMGDGSFGGTSKSKITDKQIEGTGYTKKNGKWYYTGKGVN